MFSSLIVLVLVYFLYSFIQQLLYVYRSGTPFEVLHWVMLGMCVLFVPSIIIMGIRAWKDNKKQQAERAEEELKQREKLATRRRSRYIDDDFDESYSELDTPPVSDAESGEDADESPDDEWDTADDSESGEFDQAQDHAPADRPKSKYDLEYDA